MDGLETARRMRELVGPETLVIIMSAYDWAQIESEARAAGVDHFISKPMFPESVRDALSRAVQDAPPAGFLPILRGTDIASGGQRDQYGNCAHAAGNAGVDR